MTTRRRATTYRHPVNKQLIEEASAGIRIADGVTGFMGSWRFIIIQTVIVIIWISGNVYLLFHFDAYPFILLNLAFSTQAAYAAPLILLAGNRAAVRDRLTLEHTAAETDKGEAQNREILGGIKRLEQTNNELLERIVGLEQTILANQKTVMDAVGIALETPPPGAPGKARPASAAPSKGSAG